jgi:aldehyde:ferredoxin oxidoreductase
MLEKMVKREGLGDLLADGVRKAAEKIGKGAEQYGMHVAGQELPAHDPRSGRHWAYAYQVDATPARHTQGAEGPPPPPGVMPEYDRNALEGRGKPHCIAANFSHFMSATGLCSMVIGSYPHVDVFIEFINAITGWDITFDEIQKTGERITNIRQAFNIREGLNFIKFKVPDRVWGRPPKTEGPLAGYTIDQEVVLKEYLTTRDWDMETAKPSKKKLLELGLDDVARDFWPD